MNTNYLNRIRIILFLFIGLVLILPLDAQKNLISEADMKKYILSQIEDYDPIIGIYTTKQYEIKSISGKIITLDITPGGGNREAIIRKNSCFVTLVIPNPMDINMKPCNILPTSNPNIYLINDNKLVMNSDGNYELVQELTPQQIIDATSLTAVDIYRVNYKVWIKKEWIKIFPTKWDIDQAIKEAESNKENVPSTGTGFAISSSGLIVTNYHVIEGAKSIAIKGVNQDFNTSYKATIIVSDARSDLAILKIDDTRFTILNSLPYMIRQNPVDVGESIFVLGYPLTATMGEEVKLTNGIISSKTGYEGDISMYQISAAVQPGNSGAPLFDNQGNIIGIVTAKHSQAENAGYAIKSNYLQNLFNIMSDPPRLPTVNTISTKSLPEKVKVLSNFVFIITVNAN